MGPIHPDPGGRRLNLVGFVLAFVPALAITVGAVMTHGAGGLWFLPVALVPALLVWAAVGARRRGGHGGMLAAATLVVLCVLAAPSIGLFFAPAAIVSVVIAARPEPLAPTSRAS